jgi:outer membrane protein
MSYLDSHHVDYYGVSESEVSQDRVAYKGDSALNASIGFSIATPILFGGYTRMNIEYVWFDSTITHSLLVDSDSSLSDQLFFTKIF